MVRLYFDSFCRRPRAQPAQPGAPGWLLVRYEQRWNLCCPTLSESGALGDMAVIEGVESLK